MNSQNKLIEIFYSNFNAGIDYEGIQEVYGLLLSRYIKIKKVAICPVKKLHQIIDEVLDGKIKIFDYEGGEKRRVALKIIAGDYILNSFNQQVDYEVNYYGRRPDVISKDKTIVFECGDTDPRKILEYFSNDENLAIYILPYPYFEQENLVAYLFLKERRGLQEYLRTKCIDSLADVRQIIASRKYPNDF